MDEIEETLTALMEAYESNDVVQTQHLQSKAMACVSQQPSLVLE